MIRFFVRLAIAALADWLTWQISTPQMRFERATRKQRRGLLMAIEACGPAVEEFGLVLWRLSESLAVCVEVHYTEEGE